MTTIKILEKLISFDSQNPKTNLGIVKYIASLFPQKICRITKLKKGNLDIYNLIIKFKGKSSANPLIFSGHTDTVPTSSKWTKNPFQAEIKNGKIYGLGSTDMKSGLAAMITTALSIKETPINDVYFIFDADEEESCTGGYAFLKDIKIKPGTAKIIIAEPTNGELIIGQKGVIDIRISFAGKSFHSSKTDPEKNKKFNAIDKAGRMIAALQYLEQKLVKKADPLFGAPTQAICKIGGGTAGNVIPDFCELAISRRFLPNENPQQIIAEVEKLAKKIDPQAKVQGNFLGQANLLSQKSDLLKEAKKISQQMLKKEKVTVAPYWTQAGNFKLWGDCLIWGPGLVEMAHQANEYCPIKQIGQMTECYKMLLQKINDNAKKSKKSSSSGSPS